PRDNMPRFPTILAVAATATFVLACDRAGPVMQPPPQGLRLEAPDPSFRLSPEERSQVAPAYDADALERLLATIYPPARADILKKFLVKHDNPNPARLTTVSRFTDPVLQHLLDEVWAPFWAQNP